MSGLDDAPENYGGRVIRNGLKDAPSARVAARIVGASRLYETAESPAPIGKSAIYGDTKPPCTARLYTPTEAAALCGVTLAGLLNWVRDGRMEAQRIGKRNYLIPASAVDAMLASRQPPPPISADALGDRLAHLAAVAKPARKSRRG